MTQCRWNLLTAVSLAAILAGFLLVRSGLSWGKAAIVLGCTAFVASLLGGRRYGGGVWGIQALDPLHCPHCGAVASAQDLPY